MTSDVENSAIFVDAVDAFGDLPAQERQFFGSGDIVDAPPCCDEMLHFAENPRRTDRSATDHNTVDSVSVEAFSETFRGCDVAVPDDRDRHSRIGFNLCDERPVSLTGVQLRARSAVDSKRFDSAVLEAFGEVDDNFVFAVPAESCFDRHGKFYGGDDGTSDGEEEVDVAEISAARTIESISLPYI